MSGQIEVERIGRVNYAGSPKEVIDSHHYGNHDLLHLEDDYMEI